MRKLPLFILLLGSLAYSQNTARMLSGVNYQNGTSYLFAPSDTTKVVAFSNVAPVAAALPTPTVIGLGTGIVFAVNNLGLGTVTITCTLCTINGSSTLTLLTGAGADIYSDGTNYTAIQGAGNSLPIPSSINLCLVSTGSTAGAWAWQSCSGSVSSNWSDIVPGTGTISSGTFNVGTGSSIAVTGSGTINATTLGGATFASPGAIGGTTAATIKGTTINATTGFQINGTAPNSHCLIGNGTNYVDSASCGGGSSVWSSLTAPTTNLSLPGYQTVLTPFTTTFTAGDFGASPLTTTGAMNFTDASTTSTDTTADLGCSVPNTSYHYCFLAMLDGFEQMAIFGYGSSHTGETSIGNVILPANLNRGAYDSKFWVMSGSHPINSTQYVSNTSFTGTVLKLESATAPSSAWTALAVCGSASTSDASCVTNQFTIDGAGNVTINGCGAGTFVKADGTGCATPSGAGTVTSSGPPTSGQIAKFTSSTNIASAAAADIVNLFSGCSGTQYLGADGACHNGTGGSSVGSQFAIQYSSDGVGGFGGVNPPTSPNGVPQVVVGIPSGGVATTPQNALPGLVGRVVSTNTDTISSTDCNPKRIEYTFNGTVAVTLPTATTLAVPYCTFKISIPQASTTTSVTVTPTTWTVNGGSTSLTILNGETATFFVDPNSTTNWQADPVVINDDTGNTIIPGTFSAESTASITGNTTVGGTLGVTGNFTGSGAANSFPNGPVTVGSSTGISTACPSGVTGAFCAAEASTIGTPTAGVDYIRADSTAHKFLCSQNGGAEVPCTGGSVTSVGLTQTGSFFTITGTPVTSSGNINIAPGILPVANGGTGTSTPSLVAGTNVTISGSWPNQTVNASGGGGGGTVTTSGSPAIHQVSIFSSATAITGVAVGATNTVLCGSTGADPSFCSLGTAALPAAIKVESCDISIGNGVNAIPANTYPIVGCKNDTGATLTITGVQCYTDSGTSTCQAAISSAGGNILSSAVTGTTSFAAGTQSANTTITTGKWLIGSLVLDGTTTQLILHVIGTL